VCHEQGVYDVISDSDAAWGAMDAVLVAAKDGLPEAEVDSLLSGYYAAAAEAGNERGIEISPEDAFMYMMLVGILRDAPKEGPDG
jgi:hypothetical protein